MRLTAGSITASVTLPCDSWRWSSRGEKAGHKVLCCPSWYMSACGGCGVCLGCPAYLSPSIGRGTAWTPGCTAQLRPTLLANVALHSFPRAPSKFGRWSFGEWTFHMPEPVRRASAPMLAVAKQLSQCTLCLRESDLKPVQVARGDPILAHIPRVWAPPAVPEKSSCS